MATLHLICGLPGSGKTTVAKQIEKEQAALRLSPDDWITPFGIDPYDERMRAVVESVQWHIAARTLELDVDVVIDFGFWSQQERDDYRARARAVGARVKLIFLDLTRDQLWDRLSKRNANLPPHTLVVEEAQLDRWLRLFERPDADELHRGQAD